MTEQRADRAGGSGTDEDLEEGGAPTAPDEGEAVSDYFGFTEIFKRVLATADHELNVSNLYLFLSALGAGAAIGLTFLSRIICTVGAGEKEPGLIGNILYPIGFIIIVLGRYQLFTENTLTPVTLVLTKLASLRELLRLWVVVFVGNMVGAILFALAVAKSQVLTHERTIKAMEIGRHAVSTEWWQVFDRGVVAGGIVAAMVWLVHSMRDSIGRAAMVYLMMYLVGVGTFFHVITSSVEVFYVAFADPTISFLALWPDFVAPVFLGNTIGGIVFVAVLNYAQFSEHKDSDLLQEYGSRMSTSQWLFGKRSDRKR